MLTLAIYHNIHLTRDQRYHLHAGLDLEVVGVSIPIWFNNKISNEPAKEVVCKYKLRNTKENMPIEFEPDGYLINIPHKPGVNPTLTDEEWRKLYAEEPELLQQIYQQCWGELSTQNLLDIKDGGSAHLYYREHNKLKSEGKDVHLVHFVVISKIEELIESFSYA